MYYMIKGVAAGLIVHLLVYLLQKAFVVLFGRKRS